MSLILHPVLASAAYQATLPQLKARLAGLKADDPELAVVVKGSDEVEYQGMVGILDTLQELDISKVGLATD